MLQEDRQMPRKVFINQPVADLPRSMQFWRALGFDFNLDWTDDTAACLVFSDDIYAMIMTHEKFQGFAQVPPADARKARECLVAVSVEARDEVDRIAEAAAANGGAAHGEPQDHGFMYYRAFQDPDGHVWELTHFPAAA
jgi:predicted lactoylglutathione lyase